MKGLEAGLKSLASPEPAPEGASPRIETHRNGFGQGSRLHPIFDRVSGAASKTPPMRSVERRAAQRIQP